MLEGRGGTRKYEFALVAERLLAREEDANSATVELLAPDELGGDVIPPRLLKMHSQWLDRDLGVILFRPIDYQDRTCDFLLGVRYTTEFIAAGELLRVPEHLNDKRPVNFFKVVQTRTDSGFGTDS
jgi:hypothetical protein